MKLVSIIIGVVILFLGGIFFTQDTQKDHDIQGGDMSTILDLSSKNLTRVPNSVFEKKDLEELDLSDNQLSGSLQAEVRFLSNLKILKLNDNQFTGVPAEVGQLLKLEMLDLSNNQLTGLPHELGKLSNLKLLDLSGNDYSEQDLVIIRSQLPESTIIKQ